MKTFGALSLAVFLAVTTTQVADAQRADRSSLVSKVESDKHLAGWKAKPKEAAMMLIGKYGQPHEATASRLIWHNNGPWAFTEIVNEEIPHDFPVPHVDFMYQAVSHKIDADRVDEITAFDGSVYVDRTKGMLAARCDKEEPNFLAVNLGHEVLMGKREVQDARKMYAESMMTLMKTKKPNEYQTGLRFKPMMGNQGDKDMPHEMKMR